MDISPLGTQSNSAQEVYGDMLRETYYERFQTSNISNTVRQALKQAQCLEPAEQVLLEELGHQRLHFYQKIATFEVQNPVAACVAKLSKG